MPGYTTEKLVDAMLAKCLPIYWGDPRVGDGFNTKSFLNYADFPNEDALIEKIIELDRDDAKYLEYMRQPNFHNNTPNSEFDRNRILDFFERIFSAKIRPVSTRRPVDANRALDSRQEEAPQLDIVGYRRRNRRFCSEWAALRNGLVNR